MNIYAFSKKDECEGEGLNLGATPSGNKKHMVAKLKQFHTEKAQTLLSTNRDL